MATATVPVVLNLPTPLTRRRRRTRLLAVLSLCGLAMMLGSMLRPAVRPPNQAPPLAQVAPFVHLASVIVAEPSMPTPLPIHVGPAEPTLQGGWLTILGLPPLASLSEGQAIAPGSWKVPSSRLPQLVITAPSGESLRSRVTVALASADGTVLAESRSMLVVMPAAQFIVARRESVGTEPPEVETVVCPDTVSAERQGRGAETSALSKQEARLRAQRLVQIGDTWLASGNIAAARSFFQRAMELGSASGAFALGTTYDPHELPRAHLTGIGADVQKARCWYQKARELAQAEAAYHLKRLEPRRSSDIRNAQNSPPTAPGSTHQR